MEQRPLRLGDIVDDYCPRERRITNHAVVAIVDDAIKQTRCTTCDAEHAYKDAKVPRRTSLKKKDDAPGQLVQSRATATAPLAASAENDTTETQMADAPVETAPSEDPETNPNTNEERREDGAAAAWFGHRPLIRATLPRTETDPPPARPIPEFTMHQRNTRGARAFRQAHGWQGNGHSPNGNRNDHGGFNHRGGGQGHGRHGQGGNSNRHRGGNKRSR